MSSSWFDESKVEKNSKSSSVVTYSTSDVPQVLHGMVHRMTGRDVMVNGMVLEAFIGSKDVGSSEQTRSPVAGASSRVGSVFGREGKSKKSSYSYREWPAI
jgi:hypothetical protein